MWWRNPFSLGEKAARKGRMRAFVIYDPVMVASSGDALSGGGFVEAIRHTLIPLVDCLTPNLAEAAMRCLASRSLKAKRTWRARARRC